MLIHWYPGHMNKAKKEMERSLSMVDIAVEVVDARAPEATRNPDIVQLLKNKKTLLVLNKADLADANITRRWIAYYNSLGMPTIALSATSASSKKRLLAALDPISRQVIDRWKRKGASKIVRAMVAGIPNVGKSSIINLLAPSAHAKTGAKPGLTRGKQWVRINPFLELMDTPGLLWPKLSDQEAAKKLAYLNAINEDILQTEELAQNLLLCLYEISPEIIAKRYNIATSEDAEAMLYAIGIARKFLLKGGEVDIERAAYVVLDEFRAGRLGRISLERPPEMHIEDLGEESF